MSTGAGGDPDLHLGTAYFASQYDGDDDPWGFDQRWYERRKHALTVALLPRRRYRRAVEPGCANGTLTELLAPRCDELHAFDMMDGPVARARTRLAGQPHVEVRQATFPTWWPPGTGDLVVWSEVAYYLTEQGATAALDGLARWLEPGGTVVAVHWTGPTNYHRAGAEIDPWLDAVPFLRRVASHVEPSFTAGAWTRATDGDGTDGQEPPSTS